MKSILLAIPVVILVLIMIPFTENQITTQEIEQIQSPNTGKISGHWTFEHRDFDGNLLSISENDNIIVDEGFD